MFKNVTVLKIADEATRAEFRTMPERVTEPTITDPDKTEWSRAGFYKPECFGASTVFVGADNAMVFCVQIRERLLPGKVIRTHVAERVAELEERQGGKRLSRKERAEIKDEIVMRLLPTAFIKATDVLCMVTRNYLIVGSSSASVVDRCVGVLNSRFDGMLGLHFLARNRTPATWMFDLLDSGTTDSGSFTCLNDAVLRGNNKSTARFKDIDDINSNDAVKDALVSGMRPTELAVMYDGGTLSFSINDKLVIKKIRFSDVLLNQAEGEADGDPVVHFDSNVALVGGTIVGLLDTMLGEMPETGDDLEDDDNDAEDEL